MSRATKFLVLGSIAAVHIKLFHHVHGSSFDYITLGLLAMVSWIGVTGVGEAALIAAGIFAANKKLDLAPILAVAWAGAVLGGSIGWLIGLKAGRKIMMLPGPLRKLRLRALEYGERLYDRYHVLAVFLTPTWSAGVHKLRWLKFFPVNVAAAFVWVLMFGLGAYLIGAPIAEAAGDIGWASVAVVVVVLGVAIGRHKLRQSGKTNK